MVNKYFEWLTNKIYADPKYSKLLEVLYEYDFEYTLPMDDNRYADGIDLRYRFGTEQGYRESEVAYTIDDMPCSILEMMVALALRIEETIMTDQDRGDRTSKWFWDMIHSLGLNKATDDRFDMDEVNDILNTFLSREYYPNGKGGLFTVEDPLRDMRTVEIWYQAMWYLNDEIEKGE